MRASDLPLEYNAAQVLEHNLRARGDELALRTPERQIRFAELVAEANRVGNGLRALGVKRGDRVGLLCLDSVEWVASFFGILKLGAVAVSLNTLLKPEEHAYMLRDSRARALIAHEELLPPPALRRKIDELEAVVSVGGTGSGGELPYADWIAEQGRELHMVLTHREEICSINYSSGTTGESKGIPHAHKDYPLTAELVGRRTFGLAASDRTFSAAKLFFTFGTGGNLIFPFYVGASAILYAGSPRKPRSVLEMIDRFSPTILYHAPTGYASILALDDFTERFDLSSLRLCISAGEALPASIWHAWKERTGLDILDGIGSTENYHMFCCNHPGDIRPGSSGKPVQGYELRLVDEDGGEVGKDELGDLHVRGETAALAYVNLYSVSRRTFLGEWMVTGDRYRRDADGYFWHAGRSDDMLKVGGIWVSPVEVESVLMSHPAVLECIIVGHPDRSSLIKPKAFVVLKPGISGSEELAAELVTHCRQQAAEYKRPRWIEFVDDLPKTATGKIQRFRMRESQGATSHRRPLTEDVD